MGAMGMIGAAGAVGITGTTSAAGTMGTMGTTAVTMGCAADTMRGAGRLTTAAGGRWPATWSATGL